MDISAVPLILKALQSVGSTVTDVNAFLPPSMRSVVKSAGFTSTTNFLSSTVNSLLSQINTTYRSPKLSVTIPSTGQQYSVLLFCTGYKEKWETEISQKMLINVNGNRAYNTDNFAVKPKKWELTGYIMSQSLAQQWIDKALTCGDVSNVNALEMVKDSLKEMSCLYMPSLLKQKKVVAAMRAARIPLTFRDKHGDNYYVGIENIEWDTDLTAQNAYPFTMSLVETPVLNVSVGALTDEDLVSYKKTVEKSTAQAAGNQSLEYTRWYGGNAANLSDKSLPLYNEGLGAKFMSAL